MYQIKYIHVLIMCMDIFWNCIGHVWDMFRTYFEDALGMCWIYVVHMLYLFLDMFWICFGHV